MNSKGKNGPAFPIHPQLPATVGCINSKSDAGMMLLDYFAAKAMQSLILDKHYQKMAKDHPAEMLDLHETLAAESYGIADAMLKVRPTI